jgi:type I restriction enzyme R subunit
MKQKNLAAELLRKLIAEQVHLYQRKDFVQAQKFSERMQALMNAYRNGQLTNADVIEELKKMALDIAAAHQEGKTLGLSPEELAFYHALSNPLTRRKARKRQLTPSSPNAKCGLTKHNYTFWFFITIK